MGNVKVQMNTICKFALFYIFRKHNKDIMLNLLRKHEDMVKLKKKFVDIKKMRKLLRHKKF